MIHRLVKPLKGPFILERVPTEAHIARHLADPLIPLYMAFDQSAAGKGGCFKVVDAVEGAARFPHLLSAWWAACRIPTGSSSYLKIKRLHAHTYQ